MKVFRKIILIRLVTSLALIALLNMSVRLDCIMDCFPGADISYLLMEELAETGETETEKGSETFSGLELFLVRQYHSFQTRFFTKSIGIFIHSTKIPPHPHFDKVTPPPKG